MVHALQRIHAALEPAGKVIDTQPVSVHPVVEDARSRLGELDMREWLRTVSLVDELLGRTVDAGLYSIETERRFMVRDIWDSESDCAETVAKWQGTRIPLALTDRLAQARAPVTVHQEVRLRLLRAI